MTLLFRTMALLLLMLAGPALAAPPPLILISIDGFRADYLDRGVSPTLSALAATGVRATRMTPSFPAVTFPNHTALVTGLYPDHNGIVNNAFDDPALPGHFTMGSHEVAWWGQSTPIWISAERAGIHTGVEFWPGVGVAHQGVRPGLWHDFDHAVTPADRVDTVLGWMDLPPDRRPGFAVLYFESVDSAGHSFGPDSPQVNAAIADIDTAVARLVDGLKARGMAANLIIVADHGMAPVGKDHLVLLDDVIDTGAVHVAFDGTVLGIDTPGTPAGDAVRAKLLAPQPHLHCWDKTKIPADLHYGSNPRVPSLVCQVETGWLVLTRESWQRGQAIHPGIEMGAHGYAINDPRMGALFIANGPAFRTGLTIAPFPNVDVYPLMAKVLGITPLANDGRLSDLAPILAP
jgi:predicted AlkP superfamily pyrophosphatase or phosphodiesterase